MSQVVQVAGPRRAPRPRAPAFRGIAPGAGGTATVAFGTSRSQGRPQKKRKPKTKPKNGHNLDAWNAFSPSHLALPRAVGEYTVTRGTRQISTTDKLIIVGTFQRSQDDGGTPLGSGRNWSDVVALSCNNLALRANEIGWVNHKMPMLQSGLGAHCQVTPAACSVQIMNGNALQTTSGMLYIGKLKVQPLYAGSTETAQAIADNFVSYMAPRLCAAAKLALRGVHVDAHPLNMNRLSDFTQICRAFPDGTGAWSNDLTPAGFTPIVIYNPDGVELNLLVCQEYRTRFELFNPACASHKYHPPSTDMDWAGMVKKAADLGSGALDIADVVAKSGILQRFSSMALK